MFDWFYDNIHWLPPIAILLLLIYQVRNAENWLVRRFFFTGLYAAIALGIIIVLSVWLPKDFNADFHRITRPAFMALLILILLAFLLVQVPADVITRITGHAELNSKPQRYGTVPWWLAMVLLAIGSSWFAQLAMRDYPVQTIHALEAYQPGAAKHLRKDYCKKWLAKMKSEAKTETEKKMIELLDPSNHLFTHDDCLGYD